jgi:pyruvate dehydrogenase E2 component (dihydrolipoamide acetyltransferase)
MRLSMRVCGGLLVAVVAVLAGCANDESATPVHNKDLGTRKGETLVPYEPVVSRKITQDPSTFPMPSAPAAAEAPATAAAATEEAAATAPADEFVTLARQVVESLATGQYAKVVSVFDANLKTQLTEAQVQAAWEAAVAAAGAFKEQGSVRREAAEGVEVAVVTCVMEKTPIEVRVAFSPAKEVSGLAIPAGQAAPAEPAAPATPEPAPAAASPAGAGRDVSGPSGMGELPPTAPAPVGLGN